MSPYWPLMKRRHGLIFLGHDWSEDHHDVAVINQAGELVRSARLGEGVAGVAGLHA